MVNRTVKARLLEASQQLQDISEQMAALTFGRSLEDLSMMERSKLSEAIGKVGGLGLGLSWIAKYELEEPK